MRQMELSRIVPYLLSALALTLCFPSRPLNERSTELALQAWLLVEQDHQQQQNRPGDEGGAPGSAAGGRGGQGPRRRITPKSVFQVPKFATERTAAPDCDDGYKADPTGRCVKLFKINDTTHLDYLSQVLKQKLAPVSSENKSSNEPVSLTIPLPESDHERDQEVMIVISKTNETKDGTMSVVNSVLAVGESDGLVDKVNHQQEETTTVDTTETTTLLEDQTTPQPDANTSTEEDGPPETTTDDSPETTTVFDGEQQALFFLTAPSDSSTPKRSPGLPQAVHLDPLIASDGHNFVRFPSEEEDEFASYASRFKHDHRLEPLFEDEGGFGDDEEEEEEEPSWSSSSQLGSFRFPTRYRHAGGESYYYGRFPGESDVVFRHRPRGRFR